MDTLTSDARISAFRATDSFAVEAYRVSRSLRPSDGDGLAREIRRTAIRSGGALVAASASAPGGDEERRHLRRARAILLEGRYYLYLARRFGLLDQTRYRGLTVRQDAALREIDGFLTPASRRSGRAPP